MAKKWNEVAGSEAFKALKPEQQDEARRQYFDQVVAPQVPDEHVDQAWEQFSRDAGVGRRELPAGVKPSTAGGGRGTTIPTAKPVAEPSPVPASDAADTETVYDPVSGMPLGVQAKQTSDGRAVDDRRTRGPGRITQADIPAMSPGSLAQDVASGVLQIAPTVVKGVGDVARLATGDRVGKGLSEFAERGIGAIQDVVGSERGAAQRKMFSQDMQDPALNAADVVFGNPGALSDQVIPTVGSMALPVGAAKVADIITTGSKAAKLAAAIDAGTVAARAAKARGAAVAGTTVAQNASDTYSTVRDAGGTQEESYLAAALTAPATYLAGKITGGGAEGELAKHFAGGKVASGVVNTVKSAAREGVQEGIEQVGQSVGEAVGKGEPLDANKLGKEVAVATTLGGIVGGGSHALTERIQRMRDAGEKDAADMLQRRVDTESAAAELDTLGKVAPQHAGHPAFQSAYQTARVDGFKPAEAAARAGILTGYGELAQTAGVPQKAIDAAVAAATKVPMAKLPGFLERYTASLATKGLGQGVEAGQISRTLAAVGDSALNAAVDGLYPNDVKSTMASIEDLESQQSATGPATPSLETTGDAEATGQGQTTETVGQGNQTGAPAPSDAATAADVPGAGATELQADGLVDPAIALDTAAHAAATSPHNDLPEPTQAQKEAGNYKVGRINLHGLNISIENPEGSVRRGVGADGKPWENTLAAHYGYIRGTEGNDGDHVDTFIGPNPTSEKVFIVDQVNKDGSFDEHKVVLGADNLQQADNLYHDNYHEGWTGRGAITEMSMSDFKKWVKDGTKTQPVGQIATSDKGAAPADAQTGVPAEASDAPGQATDRVFLGRQNTPLSEGGKPFKTRKAADDARRLNPGMRVVRADGGYALTEKTPAQLAAEEKAAKRLRNPQTSARGEPIPAHAMIAAAGGLAPETRADMGMQGNVQIGNRKLFAGPGKGLTIERATERLVEEGYLPTGASHDDARDLIKRSLTKPQYNAEGYERLAELDAMERFDAAQLEEDEAVAEIEALSDNQLDTLLDADIPWDAVSNTDTESAMRALGFTEQEIQDAIADQSGEPQDAGSSRSGLDEGATSEAQADPGSREETAPEPEEVKASAGLRSNSDDSAGVASAGAGSTGPERGRKTTGEGRDVLRNDDVPPASRRDKDPDTAAKREVLNQTPATAGVSVSAFDIVKRADGTLAVKGDPSAIREALKDIPARSLSPMRDGILVGRTQADKAMAILQPAELTAPTKDDVLAQQERADKAAKDKAAADRAAEKKAAEDEDRKRIAKASEAAADTFELGGDAMANLTGQQDIFADTPAPKQEPSRTEAPKIEDFGEKIAGARKDYAQKLQDAESLDVATEPLSKTWPEPNYEKLLEAGASPWVTAFVHTARDMVPVKPKQRWKLKQYVSQVELMREVSSRLLSGEITEAAARAKLLSPEFSRLYNGMASGIQLYQLVGHSKSLKGIEISRGEYSLYNGVRHDPPKVIWTVGERHSPFSKDTVSGFTEDEALAAFKAKYQSMGEAPKKSTEFIIWGSGGKYHVGKKIGRDYVELAKPFDTVADARTYRAENQAELETKLERYRSAPFERNAENQPRIGDDHRNGASVTPEGFTEAFGFRGVQFGNYVEGTRRQLDLNNAYDGLSDLAAVLNIPTRAISLNGQLGLAFGARGKGGKNPHAAHYEPGQVVINLTKNNGAGSLAHEWFHAMDNYFAKLDGGGKGYVTDGERNPNIRPEMVEAFKNLMTAIRASGMRKRSVELDKRRSSPYWSTNEEMAARAFESYVINKLHDQNASNDYLANVVGENFWKAQDALFGHEGEESYPYPKQSEIAAIAQAFDKFFETVQTKETDKGVALFARGAPQTEAFKKWFGDSKVVDAEGKPLVMFHGTSRSEGGDAFTAFDTYASNYGLMGQGGYFTADPEVASSYTSKGKGTTPTVYAAYLSIKNPIDMDAKADPEAWQQQFDGIDDYHEGGDTNESWYRAAEALITDQEVPMYEGAEMMQEGLRAMGYDGITHIGGGRVRSDGVRHRVYVAFDPEQIKSATGNNGQFDPANPDIRYALGAEAFRIGVAPRNFMAVTAVQKAVDELTAKWTDGPGIKVVTTAEELPVEAPSDARGLIHNGTAYIVAANHIDRAGVAKTLAHEAIGHYGLWKALGTDGRRQFERNLQLALKSGNKPLNAIAARVRELYVDDAGKFNLSPAEEANEIAAFAVEEALDSDGNFKPGYGFLKEVWSKVATFLRSIGINVKFTNTELQGLLVASMRGLEAGKRLDGNAEGLVAAAVGRADIADPQTGVSTALLELGQHEDLYRYPRSDSLNLEHIAEDKGNLIKVSDVDKTSDDNKTWMLSNTTPNDDPAKGIKSWLLTLPNGKMGTLTKKGGEVYINVSGVGENNGGSAIYDLAANYALNNGLEFIGDPNGVSKAAMRRRLENMLSSAVKYGTTDHLRPHPDQYIGDAEIGIPPLDWTTGDTLGNIRSMVDASIAATDFLYPGRSNDIRFDPANGTFRDQDGNRLDAEALAGIYSDRGRAGGIGAPGISTVQRNALYKSLVQSEGARRALLAHVYPGRGGAGQGLGEGLERTFYARGVTPGLFAPTVWNTPDATRTDRIIYELQDGRIDLKRVQQAIEKSGQQIQEKWDARLAETLYPGRVAYRSQRFLDAEVKPLLKAIAVHGVAMDELADYLHARGAEERNAQIAKVNPDLPDGGAGKNSKGLLLTNQAARDYLAAISPTRRQLLDTLAAKVDAITAGTRKLLVDEGLEKQETIDAWTDTYKNYVPMFRDEAQSGAPHPQGSGFTVKGSASKRATGSTKQVTNILAHVLMQREAAITRAEKNRVALSLYGQALSHPNPEFWTTIKPSMTNAAIGKELQAMGVDPATAAAGMERAPTITTVDPDTGKKVDRPNPLYKSLPGAIPLKVNGEDRVLMINTEHERGARMAENLKNLDGLTKLDLANTIIGKGTRWLASVNTQYNPAFGLVNLTRDTLGGSINLGSTELRGNALKVLAQTPAAIFGIARELASEGSTGKWQTLYRQFQADGGQTGYKENFRDANDRAKAIEKELAALQRVGTLHPARAAHAILDLLDGFNTTLENAVRLSAYKAGLDQGMSGPQAARLGRELTVDFNRKGRAGREVGPLYAFFNASVQGIARGVQTLKGPTGKAIIVGGLGLGVLQALMLAAAGYDDDDVPEFVKTRALIIPILGKEKRYVAVPYPLELQMIPNTGRVLTELALNGGKNVGKRVFDAVGTIAGSFNPLGGGNIFTADGALKTVAPTLVDPLIELGFNKNFAGGTIERAPYKGESDSRPGAARVKESTMRTATGQAYIGISKAINSLAGGTDYEAGLVSPTPERVRYIAQTVGGGVLRELEKTVNAGVAKSRGEPVKMSQIPVAGRFYGEVDSDQVKTSRYFENAGKLDRLETTVKTMVKAGDGDALDKLQAEHPEIALISLGNKVQTAVAKLNKVAVTTVGDAERIKQIDAARVEAMDMLNQAMTELENAQHPDTLGAKVKSMGKQGTKP